MKLIDLDALGVGTANPAMFENRGVADGWNSLYSILQNAPVVDVATVTQGRWVWFENRPVADTDDPDCIGCTGYECSECGNNEGTCIRFYEELSPMVLADIKEGLKESLTNYCPSCGAKMNGDSPHNVGQTTGGAAG